MDVNAYRERLVTAKQQHDAEEITDEHYAEALLAVVGDGQLSARAEADEEWGQMWLEQAQRIDVSTPDGTERAVSEVLVKLDHLLTDNWRIAAVE